MKKPCVQCPFNKKANLTINQLGGSHPSVYIGQSHSPFWLPCHMDGKYAGKESEPDEVNTCIGAAMFRSKLNCSDLFPRSELLPVYEDTDNLVFDSATDFLSHYLQISPGEAEELTDVVHIRQYILTEYQKVLTEGRILEKI